MRTNRRIVGAGAAGLAAVAALILVLTVRGGEACPEAVALGPIQLAAGPVSTAQQQGRATHYGPATSGGACGFPTAPANGYGTALGPAEFAGAAACGGYIEVTGPKGTVTVKVTNLCPECGPGHLDLNDEAFAAIGDLPAGLIPITYRAVEDAAVPGPMSVFVKEGSSQWWLGLLIDNQRNPLASVEVSAAGGQWLSLRRVDYGFWLAENGTGPGPLDVRVTEVTGRATLLPGIEIAPGTVQVPGGAAEVDAPPPVPPPAPAPTGTPAAAPPTTETPATPAAPTTTGTTTTATSTTDTTTAASGNPRSTPTGSPATAGGQAAASTGDGCPPTRALGTTVSDLLRGLS